MRKNIQTSMAPSAIGPYSQGVMVNGVLYTSGQIAINPLNEEMNNSTIESETTQVMLNLEAVLSEAGLRFSDVVKTSIFLKDMSDFDRVNKIYASFFKDFFPARETIQVSKLPRDVSVEISMIAVQAH